MSKKKPFEREPANEEWFLKNIKKIEGLLPQLAEGLREVKKERDGNK